ncbi:MAG: tetraacyldisaccharide 4'-kinase [Alphaproteobacteria bacterium]|nr:tetraacyldisaccharide 4'-kinase [Alphaproteobacteria bacterium]
MFLKAPKFWYQIPVNENLKKYLKPISNIYKYFAKVNYSLPYRYKSSKSYVIAIGGVTIGGSGKTPVVASLCETLSTTDQKAAILSRGYGRTSNKILKVDNKIHTFKDVGDEPLLLSEYCDVFVSADRRQSAIMAEESGHTLLILDDGLTQRDLQPDAKIVVIDSSQGFGNGEMLPLGPNRLSFDILKDINGIALIKLSKYESVHMITDNIPKNIPLIVGYFEEDFSKVKEASCFVAFCGIGYPQKFFNSLEKRLHIVEKIEFPDHHPFTDEEIVDLVDEVQRHGAGLITTEKDLCRIPKRYHHLISTTSIKVVWENPMEIAGLLNL